MAHPTIKKIQVGDRTRYRWVADIGEDPKTGNRRQTRRTFDTRREAERELTKLLDRVSRGTHAAPSKITVDEYLNEWMRSATRGKADNTVEAYSNGLKPARDFFGAKQLQKLTTGDVEDLVDWMLTSGRKRGGKVGTGLSPRSVQITLSKLRAALNDAVHRRLVAFNVAAPVKCPPQVKTTRVPWSPAEVKAFLSSLDGERLRAVMLLSLLGLRPEETCGLRWDDVDLDAETLTISNVRTIVWGADGGRVVEKDPKTAAGNRALPLPAIVTAALKAYKATQARERLAAGEGYEGSGYVLVDELGRPCRTDWLRRQTYRLMAAAKVRKVRPYDARHACLTYLATSGVPDVIVSAWAGHADLTTTKRVYVHPSAKDLEQGRDALSKLLG